MKLIIKKICNCSIILFLAFFIFIYLLNTGLITIDDAIYKNAFDNISGAINWVNEFYHIWSGRITLTILINIFANLPMLIFKIANTFVFMTVILAMYKITKILIQDFTKKMKNVLLTIIFCLIFFISITVISSGTIWMAGALNYLWPLAAMLVAIIPFIKVIKNKEIKKYEYIIYICANFIACFAEQTGAILVVFGLFSIIYTLLEKKKVSKLLIAHYIVIIIITLISLLAPGNGARSLAEEIKYYGGFSMLSIWDKLIQGYINTANHIVNNSTLLFGIIAISSSYFTLKNKEMGKISKCISVLPIIYVVLRIFPFNEIFGGMISADINGGINEILFGFQKFSINTICSNKALLQLVSSSFILCIVALQLLYAFIDKKNGIITSILYCASICSALSLSFSPTIYASGNRVFTVTDFLMVLIGSILTIKLFKELNEKKNKIWILIYVAIVIIAIISYINLYKNGITNIVY